MAAEDVLEAVPLLARPLVEQRCATRVHRTLGVPEGVEASLLQPPVHARLDGGGRFDGPVLLSPTRDRGEDAESQQQGNELGAHGQVYTVLQVTRGRDFQVSIGSRHVLVVGAGGLGCPASLALARARVGTITLVDHDVVDVSNLHRQLWHRTSDVGRHKVASAAAKLRAAFPALGIEARVLRVDDSNVEPLFRSHDLVIDATDGVDIKFTLSDAAVRTGTPLIYGGVLRMQGQAMPIVKGGPCLRCLFETPPSPDEVPSCAQAGVLGSMPGIMGAIQARLAVEYLEGRLRGDGAADLLVFDGARLAGRTVQVPKAADCPVCNAGPERREERRNVGGLS